MHVYLRYPEDDVVLVQLGAHQSITVHDVDGTQNDYTDKGPPPNFNVEWFTTSPATTEVQHTTTYRGRAQDKGRYELITSVTAKPRRTSKLRQPRQPKVISNLRYVDKCIVDMKGLMATGSRTFGVVSSDTEWHVVQRFFKSKRYEQLHQCMELRGNIVPHWLRQTDMTSYQVIQLPDRYKSWTDYIPWSICADEQHLFHVEATLHEELHFHLRRYTPHSLRILLVGPPA